MRYLDFIAAISAITLLIVILNHLKLNKIMADNQEMLRLLNEADAQTNEIAADIQDLIDNGQVNAEVAQRLTAHVDKLKTVAATHTKPPTEEPPTGEARRGGK